jgi:acetolactate synthase-1/2/3 large subunit
MNGGRLLVQSLKRHGTEFVFGLVDTTILDILDALHDEPSIRYISVRHEQVASMMADGYARATGRPGVCLTQCGAGAMNLLYGVASAHRDSVPLVLITGNIESKFIGTDAWHDLDLMGLFAPVTKWTTRVKDAREIPATLERAFEIAMSGRPGPVHVNIPKDVQAAKAPALPEDAAAAANANPPAISAADVGRAVTMLAEAERPVIFAGGGVIWANASDLLLRFSERSGIPVIVSDTARGAIPESHANAFGPSGFFGSKAATDALNAADVVLGLGTRFPDVNVGSEAHIGRSKVIQNNIDPGEIGRRIPVAIGITGDARQCLEAILKEWDAAKRQVPADRASRVAAVKRAVEAERVGALTAPAGADSRIPIQAVVREIASVLGKDATVAIDGGMHCFFSARLQIERPGSFLISAGLGAMGYGLPAAMGAKLAHPDRPAVALVGDGGFAMVSQDLETAVRCNIPVVVVVYNNNAFGAQRIRQQRDYGGRLFGTTHNNPDYGELAKLYGAEGRTVRTISEFRPAFEALLRSGRVGVIDVHIQ